MTKKLLRDFCVFLCYWMAWVIALAAFNVIDFHVCIKDAGHCQIIDPTVVKVVPR